MFRAPYLKRSRCKAGLVTRRKVVPTLELLESRDLLSADVLLDSAILSPPAVAYNYVSLVHEQAPIAINHFVPITEPDQLPLDTLVLSESELLESADVLLLPSDASNFSVVADESFPAIGSMADETMPTASDTQSLTSDFEVVSVDSWVTMAPSIPIPAVVAAPGALQVELEAAPDGSLPGRLYIRGSEEADVIVVRQIDGVISIDGVAETFRAGDIQALQIDGWGGDDIILLNSESVPGQEPLQMSVDVYGWDGHDVIVGPSGPEVSWRTAGIRVWLEGGAGDDLIISNGQQDLLRGGAGNDILFAGPAISHLEGDAGDDVLVAGGGGGFMAGGSGENLYFVNDLSPLYLSPQAIRDAVLPIVELSAATSDDMADRWKQFQQPAVKAEPLTIPLVPTVVFVRPFTALSPGSTTNLAPEVRSTLKTGIESGVAPKPMAGHMQEQLKRAPAPSPEGNLPPWIEPSLAQPGQLPPTTPPATAAKPAIEPTVPGQLATQHEYVYGPDGKIVKDANGVPVTRPVGQPAEMGQLQGSLTVNYRTTTTTPELVPAQGEAHLFANQPLQQLNGPPTAATSTPRPADGAPNVATPTSDSAAVSGTSAGGGVVAGVIDWFSRTGQGFGEKLHELVDKAVQKLTSKAGQSGGPGDQLIQYMTTPDANKKAAEKAAQAAAQLGGMVLNGALTYLERSPAQNHELVSSAVRNTGDFIASHPEKVGEAAADLAVASGAFIGGNKSKKSLEAGLGFSEAAAASSVARVITNVASDSYHAVDSTNPRFSAHGTLYEGELEMTIRTKLEDGTRSAVLRGAEQYRAILDHFGDRVQTIKDSYSYGDNLVQINEMTEAGTKLEEAVTRTFAGRMAAEKGFGVAKVTGLRSARGVYESVKVIFKRR